MKRRFTTWMATLGAAAVLMLPATAMARDRDHDRDDWNRNGYYNGMSAHERHELEERQRKLRKSSARPGNALSERLLQQRSYNNGYYNNGYPYNNGSYNDGRVNGYYDRYGNFHQQGYYDRWGNYHVLNAADSDRERASASPRPFCFEDATVQASPLQWNHGERALRLLSGRASLARLLRGFP